MSGSGMGHIVDGLVAERWLECDGLGLMRQIQRWSGRRFGHAFDQAHHELDGLLAAQFLLAH